MNKALVGSVAGMFVLMGLPFLFAGGRPFMLDVLIVLTPEFYIHYWYIACIPFVLGVTRSLYKKKISYAIYGLLLTLPTSFLGSWFFLLNWKP